jgi:Na+-translocating ferredoxin:NAD+ oxidoreductase RnfA subunit
MRTCARAVIAALVVVSHSTAYHFVIDTWVLVDLIEKYLKGIKF